MWQSQQALMIVQASNFQVAIVPVGSLIVLSAALLLTVVWVWMLVDALSRPSTQWRRADLSQGVWIVVLILTNAFGALLYLLIARPRLRRSARLVEEPAL